jgi:hypothetical protein
MNDNGNKGESGTSALGDRGSQLWREHGESVGAAGRRFGYIVAIVFSALGFYVFHSLLQWRVPFVTEAWSSVLWAVDLSIAATIVANAVYFAYDPRWLRHLGGIVTNAFSFLSTYVIWRTFPFDFGETWNDMAQLVLVLVMLAIVIGIVVQSVQLITDQVRAE